VDSLARRAVEVDLENLALGSETFVADGARFVRDRAHPSIYDANHVQRVTAATPAEIERLLVRIEGEFAFCTHRMLVLDPDTPPSVEARLALEGYETSVSLVMALEGEPVGSARPSEVHPIAGAADWQAFATLKRLDWKEKMARHGVTDETIGDQLARISRRKSPGVRYWIACEDGEPCGFCSSWEGREGVGQVEDLFVRPDRRHRGLASALLRHCIADCRAHGAGPVALVADASDTPKRMYARMGFRPVALVRKYLRVDASDRTS
jgi:GNAT superfamily N-acetyltransferase